MYSYRLKVSAFVSCLFACSLAQATEPETNLLISDGDNLMVYSQDGLFIEQRTIPKNSTNEAARDIYKLDDASIAIFNGTFQPQLSVVKQEQWSHQNYDGWSIPNNGTYGGITAKDGYIYVTDGKTYNGGEAKGIVRFDSSGQNPTARFFDDNEYIDITLGLDDKLYALRNTYGDLDIIEPSTMTLISSLDLGHTSSSRAVTADSSGNIYMVSWNGNLYRYDQSGVETNSIDLSNDLYDIDLDESGTIIVSDRSGNVFVTDTSLVTPTQFNVSNSGVFVAFDKVVSVEPIPEYCQSAGSNTNYEWIEAVSLDFQDSVSGNNQGYFKDENTIFNLIKGQQYSISLQPGFNSWSYYENWNVWIDYNHDGEFSDSEKLLSEKSKNNVAGSFQVPPSAEKMETRMRVSMKYGNAPGSCENFYYGEVEDYRVIISE